MIEIPRRKVLLGTLAGPLILGQLGSIDKPAEIPDLDGRPIRRISDTKNMTAIEKQHYIQIDVPKEVKPGEPFKVSFSMPNHPMTIAHHISWMRLFVDVDLVSFVTLAPVWQRPDVTLTLTLATGKRIEVVAECNLHNLWGMSVPLGFAP